MKFVYFCKRFNTFVIILCLIKNNSILQEKASSCLETSRFPTGAWLYLLKPSVFLLSANQILGETG